MNDFHYDTSEENLNNLSENETIPKFNELEDPFKIKSSIYSKANIEKDLQESSVKTSDYGTVQKIWTNPFSKLEDL